MDDLSAHLDRYLELRRSVGFKLEEHARVLPDFVSDVRGRGETTVRTHSVLSWAAGASSERQVARRISMVRGFARYLVAFDPATEVPGRGLVSDAVVRSIPHIYTDAEISVLMELALTLRPEAFGATMSTLIGLLAATGLRPAEAWRLDDEHVDLTKHQLSVWHSKSGRSRRLPVHPSTAEALIRYSARRDRRHRHGRDGAFFVSAARNPPDQPCGERGLPGAPNARTHRHAGRPAPGAPRRPSPHLRRVDAALVAPGRG